MKIKKFGPYQTEELLGRGGMGTVYRGIHEETRQEVALKVLSFIHADDDNFRERFTLEIETLKKLRHPNIVELYGYGVQDGHLFYAMEFIQGCSLQQELNSGRRYDWREATKMAIVICQALKHAHDRGVIHRDLKPANLLIDEDHQIKLSDFGIAKLFGAHQITADRTVIGTADYMAPEQAEGVSASVKSDLYSLGSVMYALVTGKPPFAATTLAQVLNDLRHATPFPLTRQVPQIPAEFDKTVMHLLQKEPEKRFATALALANHLRAMEHGLKGKATSPQETPPKSAQTKIDTHVSEQPVSPEEDLQSDDTRALRPTVEAPQYSQGAAVAAATQESLSGEIRNPTLADTETDHTSEEKVDQFTKVDPNRSFSEDQGTEKEALLITVSKVGLTLVLIILLIGAGWYMLKPASESQLYDQIQSAAQQDPPALETVSTKIDLFLDKFPDSPHHGEVKVYQHEIKLQRLHRSFEKKTRNTRGTVNVSPVARAYLEALQTSRNNQEAAAQQMQAIIDLYAGMPDNESQQYVELARIDLADLRSLIAERRQASVKLLKSRLQYADQLAQTDTKAAQAIYRSIIVLYGDKPWAAAIVKQADQRLNP